MRSLTILPSIFLVFILTTSCGAPHDKGSTSTTEKNLEKATSNLVNKNELMNKMLGKAGGVAFEMIGSELFPDLFSSQEAIDYDQIRSIVADEIRKANNKQTDTMITGEFNGMLDTFRHHKEIWIDQVRNARKENVKISNQLTRDRMNIMQDAMFVHLHERRGIAAQPEQAEISIATYVGLSNLLQNYLGFLAVMDSTLPKLEQSKTFTNDMQTFAKESKIHINKTLIKMRKDQMTCVRGSGSRWNLMDTGNNSTTKPARAYYFDAPNKYCNKMKIFLLQVVDAGTTPYLRCDIKKGVGSIKYIAYIVDGSGTVKGRLLAGTPDWCEKNIRAMWQSDADLIGDPRLNDTFSKLLEIADSWT